MWWLKAKTDVSLLWHGLASQLRKHHKRIDAPLSESKFCVPDVSDGSPNGDLKLGNVARILSFFEAERCKGEQRSPRNTSGALERSRGPFEIRRGKFSLSADLGRPRKRRKQCHRKAKPLVRASVIAAKNSPRHHGDLEERSRRKAFERTAAL